MRTRHLVCFASRLLFAGMALAFAAFPAQATYWSLFNIEGESSIGADYVTYANLTDMVSDTNRLGVFTMNGFGRNIVGSGSDGSTYWSLFNIEGESSIGADYVTYANLTDMVSDTNRLSVFTMNGFGRNIVGSGSDEMGSVPSIPEPSTLVLAALGVVALVLRTSLTRAGKPRS